MKELRKPNVEKMKNMECYSYYYENPMYEYQTKMKEMDDAWALKQEVQGLIGSRQIKQY